MNKKLKASVWVIGTLAAILVLLIAVSFVLYPSKYIIQILQNGESQITDYQVFPTRVIAKSSKPYHYEYAPDETLGSKTVTYNIKGKKKTVPLDEMIATNCSTSFIVVHNDKVVYEKYFNGYDRLDRNLFLNRQVTQLSVDRHGHRRRFCQQRKRPHFRLYSEFAGTEFADITIEQLLLMRSENLL